MRSINYSRCRRISKLSHAAHYPQRSDFARAPLHAMWSKTDLRMSPSEMQLIRHELDPGSDEAILIAIVSEVLRVGI